MIIFASIVAVSMFVTMLVVVVLAWILPNKKT